MTSKADYVRSQGQNRDHHCHWPGCTRQVPPALWGCRPHWYQLPPGIRARIWRTFKPGQERTQTPSPDYIEAAKAAQAWIDQQLSRPCKDQNGGVVWSLDQQCKRCGKVNGQRCRWPHVAEGAAVADPS